MNVSHLFSVVVLYEQGVSVGFTVRHCGSCRHRVDRGEFTVLNPFSTFKCSVSSRIRWILMSKHIFFFRARRIFLLQTCIDLCIVHWKTFLHKALGQCGDTSCLQSHVNVTSVNVYCAVIRLRQCCEQAADYYIFDYLKTTMNRSAVCIKKKLHLAVLFSFHLLEIK